MPIPRIVNRVAVVIDKVIAPLIVVFQVGVVVINTGVKNCHLGPGAFVIHHCGRVSADMPHAPRFRIFLGRSGWNLERVNNGYQAVSFHVCYVRIIFQNRDRFLRKQGCNCIDR